MAASVLALAGGSTNQNPSNLESNTAAGKNLHPQAGKPLLERMVGKWVLRGIAGQNDPASPFGPEVAQAQTDGNVCVESSSKSWIVFGQGRPDERLRLLQGLIGGYGRQIRFRRPSELEELLHNLAFEFMLPENTRKPAQPQGAAASGLVQG